MPSRITARSLRLAVCRLTIETMRRWSMLYLDDPQYGSNCNDIILCCAILVGQLEGKPMTAAKLSTYAGIPRPTVVRKLRALERRGLVEMVCGTATLPIDLVNQISPDHLYQTMCPLVMGVHAELSKMDTRHVVRADAPK